VNNHEAWLITVCRNVALDVMRRRRPTLPIDDKVEAQRFADWRIDDAVTSRLNRLSLEHREVVFFVDVLGYDYATLSEVLDVPVGTIRSRLSRARDQLRENEVRGVDMESA
jgi:RNA polymerase sigma-70 factor (ECF subfamily)